MRTRGLGSRSFTREAKLLVRPVRSISSVEREVHALDAAAGPADHDVLRGHAGLRHLVPVRGGAAEVGLDVTRLLHQRLQGECDLVRVHVDFQRLHVWARALAEDLHFRAVHRPRFCAYRG